MRRARPLRLDGVQGGQRLLHGRIAALGGGFLAEAHEGRTDERLQLGFAFGRELVAHAANRFHQRAAVSAAVKLRQVRQSDGGRASRLGRLQRDAGRVLDENFVDGLQLAPAKHLLQKSANIARGNAPRFVGGEHFFLVFLRHLLPKLLVQQLGEGLNRQTGMRHGLFVMPENLAQRFYLLIHAVKELLDGVHAEFAAFVAVQRETNGHVLGQAEQHRFVRLLRRRLRRESGEGLLQRVLCAYRHGAQARLKCWYVELGLRVFARAAQLGK